MEKLKIGIAEIIYSETGKVLRAFFTPQMKISNIADKLLELGPNRDPAIIKQNAEIILANWFNKVNEIELADREHYHIDSEIVKCVKYQDGMVKRCVIQFYFKETVLS